MNITFNADTIALLLGELEDILCNSDFSPGTSDDLSSFLNALANISEAGAIVIVQDDGNIGDDWDDDDWDDDLPNSPLSPSGLILA